MVRHGAESLCSRNAAHRVYRICKLRAVLVGRAQLGLSPVPHLSDQELPRQSGKAVKERDL